MPQPVIDSSVPFDPREQRVTQAALQVQSERASALEADSIARAKAAAERDRKQYVLEVGKQSPLTGLRAIVDLHPDAVQVIDKWLALEDQHTPGTMAKVFVRYLRGER